MLWILFILLQKKTKQYTVNPNWFFFFFMSAVHLLFNFFYLKGLCQGSKKNSKWLHFGIVFEGFQDWLEKCNVSKTVVFFLTWSGAVNYTALECLRVLGPHNSCNNCNFSFLASTFEGFIFQNWRLLYSAECLRTTKWSCKLAKILNKHLFPYLPGSSYGFTKMLRFFRHIRPY